MPYFATKFVLSESGSVSEREAPTICFTTPACRSMQGRKADGGMSRANSISEICRGRWLPINLLVDAFVRQVKSPRYIRRSLAKASVRSISPPPPVVCSDAGFLPFYHLSRRADPSERDIPAFGDKDSADAGDVVSSGRSSSREVVQTCRSIAVCRLSWCVVNAAIG